MTELDIFFVSRFFVNLISLIVLCFVCYFRVSKNSTIAGSFLLFGVGVFIITYLLHGVDLSIEFAFGLFAVFTMLRYRTEAITIKEMTYLFLVTAISLLTSVAQMDILSLLTLNGVICFLAFIVDSRLLGKRYYNQSICYERIENITPEKRDILIADLRERTGLHIELVEIEHIDFLRDTAQLNVRYLPQDDVAVQQANESTTKVKAV